MKTARKFLIFFLCALTLMSALTLQAGAAEEIVYDTGVGKLYFDPDTGTQELYLDGVYATDLVIPQGITSIGKYALYNCPQITFLVIPGSVVTVG